MPHDHFASRCVRAVQYYLSHLAGRQVSPSVTPPTCVFETTDVTGCSRREQRLAWSGVAFTASSQYLDVIAPCYIVFCVRVICSSVAQKTHSFAQCCVGLLQPKGSACCCMLCPTSAVDASCLRFTAMFTSICEAHMRGCAWCSSAYSLQHPLVQTFAVWQDH